MKRSVVVLTIGLILFLPLLVAAQEVAPSDQMPLSDKDNSIAASPKLAQKQESNILNKTENFNDKEDLYHIVVLTKGNKKESIWVELKPGEQKYVTIELDNGRKKSVSIRLEDEKKSHPIRLSPYERLSQLMLQPISF